MMRVRRLAASVVAAAVAVGGVSAAAASAGDGVGKSGTQLGPYEIGRSANVEHLKNIPHTGPLTGATGSDLAFSDGKAFVGNYNGFVVYDVRRPSSPRMVAQVSCPGSQNDISVHGDLLFLSTDSSRSDDSCTSVAQSATEKTSWEGIKIFDISDVRNPRYIKSVETACGSHTHTLVPGKKSVYVYVSSYRPDATYPDCAPPHDSISIIDVPLKAPTSAKVVATPNLFPDGGYTTTSGCHDITAYPSKRIAAGACMGDGIIMDISNPVRPRVVERVTDTVNFAFWHSATFNHDATKVVFTDELGGGGAATCDEETGPTRGANGIYDLSRNRQLTFRSYYKIPRHQFDTENCVAHNGSLIPVKGRDVMVQSWYMGGTSFWEFTDSGNPREIGYFERGPAPTGGGGGTWSSYYYNGHVYSSDLGQGFDVMRITDRSLAKAAKVRMGELNVQSQPDYKLR
jgi:hypothetical protein